MRLLFTLLLGLISLGIFGQQSNENFKITGIVIDAETKTPLQFVTISLQDIITQEIIGDITNKNGSFEIIAPQGKYHCVVASLSFKQYVIQELDLVQSIDLGTIELIQNTEKLDEIEIIAQTKLLDFNSGKKVYNASKDVANIGGNAITVLENTPMVRVDGQGNISIRGNKAMVLVNGKPYGGLKSNADILSLIPANSISKVEILNQSSKYDAEGGGNILNLILKKRMIEGYNGTIEAHAGKPDNDGLSTFINFKTKKVNIFSTASFNHGVINKDTEIDQLFLDPNQNPIGNFEETRDDYRQRNSALINIGSDFYLNDKNTITASFLYSNTNKNYDSNLYLNDYKPVDNMIKTSLRTVDDNSDEAFIEAFLNYTTKFKKEGSELSVNINYDRNSSNNKTAILNNETFPNKDESEQMYAKDEYADNYFIQADYTLPIQDNAKLEAGFKTNYRVYENDFTASNFNTTTLEFEPILAYTNHINYDEIIYGYYANYDNELEKISYSLGLRSEITQTTIHKANVADDFKNNYTDFFPTVLLNYNFSTGNYLSAYYTKYIDRPTIAQLNPFNSFTDERFILIGNPYLTPSYSNFFTLEYYLELKKLTLNSAFFHTYTTDNILDIIEKTDHQTSDGFDIYQRIPINNGTLIQTGLDFILSYDPGTKLQFNGSVTPFFAQLTDTKDGQYDYDDFRWYGRVSANYTFNNTLKLKVDYNYQAAIKTAITEFGTYQYTNLTASHDFLDSKATLSFRAEDIFNTRKGQYKSSEANTITNRTTTFETRYLLSFSYRFNKTSKRNAHNRTKDIDKNIFEILDKTK